MAKTGCVIEMNQSKDLSLAIMVTGKPSAVKEAQRLIMTELHTKVTLLIMKVLILLCLNVSINVYST